MGMNQAQDLNPDHELEVGVWIGTSRQPAGTNWIRDLLRLIHPCWLANGKQSFALSEFLNPLLWTCLGSRRLLHMGQPHTAAHSEAGKIRARQTACALYIMPSFLYSLQALGMLMPHIPSPSSAV